MSRQKLINYHSDGQQPPLPANLELGEIAVQHNSGSTCLYVKDSAGTMRKFIDQKSIDKMIFGYLAEYGVVPSFVDLGLPSGTLWCEYNIGASTPYEPGLYFAWGEISGYTAAQVGVDKDFSEEDYILGPVDMGDRTNYGMTKYNETDGKSTLDDVDNAAKVHFGNWYTIPTRAQFQELVDNTTKTWDSTNLGMLFTSTINGKTIFFPAAGLGVIGHVDNVGRLGYYWSSSLRTGDVLNAWMLFFEDSSDYYGVGIISRFFGFSVRPVAAQNQ